MHIDLRDLPRRLTLAAGDQVTLTLPSFLGSGNAWSAHCESGADVALVSIAMEPPSPSSVTTGMLGPPEPSIATELAIVRAVAPGTARWWLHLARSFGPPEPTVVQELRIDVTADTPTYDPVQTLGPDADPRTQARDYR